MKRDVCCKYRHNEMLLLVFWYKASLDKGMSMSRSSLSPSKKILWEIVINFPVWSCIMDSFINFRCVSLFAGLVLYNGQYDSARGDYVCFGMRGGYPEFGFDVGSGPALIQGNRTLPLNQWNTIKLKRENSVGKSSCPGSKIMKLS